MVCFDFIFTPNGQCINTTIQLQDSRRACTKGLLGNAPTEPRVALMELGIAPKAASVEESDQYLVTSV